MKKKKVYKRKEVSSESQEILTGVQKSQERQSLQENGLVKSVFLYGAIGFAICIALVVGGLFV